MEVREEDLAVFGGVVATQLLVQRCESRKSVVALDAPPVVNSLDGYARYVFSLGVHNSYAIGFG